MPRLLINTTEMYLRTILELEEEALLDESMVSLSDLEPGRTA